VLHCNMRVSVICRLLQVAAAHGPQLTHFHPSTPRKRQIFVRACVKLLMSCASRYKVLLSRRELGFRAAVNKLLNDTEAVVLASMCVLSCLLIIFSSFLNELLALKLLKIMHLLNTLLTFETYICMLIANSCYAWGLANAFLLGYRKICRQFCYSFMLGKDHLIIARIGEKFAGNFCHSITPGENSVCHC
jgi:hypothetical protein